LTREHKGTGKLGSNKLTQFSFLIPVMHNIGSAGAIRAGAFRGLLKLFFVILQSLLNDFGFVYFYKFIKFLIKIDIYNRHFESERGYGYINIYVA